MQVQINHPVLKSKISSLRDRETKPSEFRQLIHSVSSILAVHATGGLQTSTSINQKQTPTSSSFYPSTISESIALFPILRSGIGMSQAFIDLLPEAHVHHLGLYREKSTHLPVEYYNRLPNECKYDVAFVLDPIIATAGTAIASINILKEWGLKKIIFVCILASQEGLNALISAHDDIEIYVGAVDDELNSEKYIIPGLGDAGDRYFNSLSNE